MKTTQIILLLIFVSIMAIVSCTAETRYVAINSSNPISPYSSWATAATNIQDAVDVSGVGDVVLVSNGVYNSGGRPIDGYLLNTRLIVTNGVTVRSVNGPQYTFIVGQGPKGDSAVRCAFLDNNSVLEGFCLSNGCTRTSGEKLRDISGGGALVLNGSELKRCIIKNCDAHFWGGGICEGKAESCLIVSNRSSKGGGVFSTEIINCTVVGNYSSGAGGGAYSSRIRNCIVYNNTSGTNSPNWYSGAPDILYTCTIPLPSGTGNITNDPAFFDAAGGDYRPVTTSPCVDSGNNGYSSCSSDVDNNDRVIGGTIDMGAYERNYFHYVSLAGNHISPFSSWASAATNIQAAIDTTISGDIVLVTNGVYATGGKAIYSNQINRVAIDKPIIVKSVNGPDFTVISGISNTVRCAYVGTNAILAGFTLTNGYAYIYSSDKAYCSGGGARCEKSAIISNCVFSGNSALYYGGGMYNGNAVNCRFINNHAGFVGGGVYTGICDNCVFVGNTSTATGGGASYSIVTNCSFINNNADSGGGVYDSTVYNSIFVTNSATDNGGGSYNGALYNCTLVNNKAGKGAGTCDSDLYNCIVWYNTSTNSSDGHNDIHNYYPSLPMVNVCSPDITNNVDGCITNAPLFVDRVRTNLQLQAGSPCVNAGTNQAWMADAIDLNGRSRIINNTVDIGAYEHAVHYVNLTSSNPVSPYLSWQTAATNIQDAVDVALAGDVVLVSNGLYSSGSRLAHGATRLVVPANITVRSINGPYSASITGVGPIGAGAVRCVYLAAGAILEGFSITNGYTKNTTSIDGYGGGVLMENGALIRNCIIADCQAYHLGGGIYANGGTIQSCLIINNRSAAGWVGGVHNGNLVNCTIVGNHANYDAGGTFGGTLRNCIVWGNTMGGNYANCQGGDIAYSCTTPLPAGIGNIDSDPLFVDASNNNYRLSADSPCINIGTNQDWMLSATDPDGYSRIRYIVDMGAFEHELTHYVSPYGAAVYPYLSWSNAATTIQDALDASEDRDTVIVTNGTYDAGGATVAGYSLLNRVAVTNAVSLKSVNGAEHTFICGDTNNINNRVRCAWLGAGAAMEGFSLIYGETLLNGDATNECSGAGVFMFDDTASLRHCIIRDCYAHYIGGGVYANGGTMENCLITGNRSDYIAGGVHNGNLINCTLADNHANNSAGGVFGGTLRNCIVWNNTAGIYANIRNADTAYTCTFPLQTGAGNIDTEPAFVDSSNGNYRLTAASPCINVGNNSFSSENTDLAGGQRIIDDKIDMGAYETGFHYVSLHGAGIPPYLSWENAATNIQDAVDAAQAHEIVKVADGEYKFGFKLATGHATRLVINSAITVRSVNGPEKTIITGRGPNGSSAIRCAYVANGGVLDGFTLYNGHTTANTFIYASDNGGGAFMTSSGTILHCIIKNCSARGHGGGIYAQGGTLESCLIRNNSADWVGGVHNGNLINCTIVANHSNNDAGGTFGGSLRNCIVWDNTAGGNYANCQGGDIAYSCTTPLPATGDGNIDSNPLFYSIADNDYRLYYSSPCFNAGTNSCVTTTTDIDGLPRILNNIVNIGAYEQGNYHFVSTNGSSIFPYSTWAEAATNIQDAIDAAAVYDNILVSNGVYNSGGRPIAGHHLPTRVIVANNIIIKSVNGPEYTFITGEGSIGTSAIRCAYIGDGSVMEGFTLHNGYTFNDFDNIYDRSGGGLLMESNAIVKRCIIYNSHADINGGGVYAQGGTLESCLIRNNSADRGGGVHNGNLINCTIVANHSNNDAGGTFGGTLRNCIVWGNTAGASSPNWQGGDFAYSCTTPLPAGTNNIDDDPLFENSTNNNYRLKPESPCYNSGNDEVVTVTKDLDGYSRQLATVDMGAYERGLIRYVSPAGTQTYPYLSWADAAHTIQTAIDASEKRDIIIVTNGVYNTGSRTIAGTPTRVIVHADVTVRSVNGPEYTSIVGQGPTGDYAAKRCVYLAPNSTLEGFCLTNGHTYYRCNGGGAYMESGAYMKRCIIRNCSAYENGGGIYANGGTLESCLIIKNSAGYVGGVHNGNLINCTIAGNHASHDAGGTFGGTLRNCIVWGNSAYHYANYQGGNIAYSCTTPLPAGSGNIAADPKFKDSASGDYSLSVSSPCINSAGNGFVTVDYDIVGNPRIMTVVDMGAYEMQRFLYFASVTGNNVYPYINLEDAATNIQDAVDAIENTNAMVVVADGVYTTGGRALAGYSTFTRVVVTNGITVRSINGPDKTVIAGKGPFGDNAVRCVYLGNNARLQGFSVSNGYTRTTGDTIFDCSGGGILMADNALVERCIICNCGSMGYGGGVCAQGGSLENCLIIHNSGNYVGGVYSGRLVNCTITVNTSFGDAGGVYGGFLTNCIVWGNSANNYPNWKDADLASCCSAPLPPGVGNISADPLFADDSTTALDCHLQLGSPCLDGGIDLPEIAEDLDGGYRPYDGDADSMPLPDMGCYESYNPVGDSDGDSMPDGWETSYGLNPLDSSDQTGNLDNDPCNNLQEYIADTDPTSGTDYFHIIAVSNLPPWTVYFTSSTGRVYTLTCCTNLQSGAWTNVPGTLQRQGCGGLDHIADTNIPPIGHFYRLKVEL